MKRNANESYENFLNRINDPVKYCNNCLVSPPAFVIFDGMGEIFTRNECLDQLRETANRKGIRITVSPFPDELQTAIDFANDNHTLTL